MISKGRLALFALVLVLVQAAVAYRYSYGILRVDLLYILAAYLALEASPKGALWSALAIGLLRDLASCARPGTSAAALVTATGALLVLRGRIYREKPVVDAVLAFIFVLCGGTLQATWLWLATPGANWPFLLWSALGQAALTAAFAPLFFFLFERGRLLDREALAVL